MLVQTGIMCFALAMMCGILCWLSRLVKKMREYNSLFLPGTDMCGFIMKVLEVLVHPYVYCLILFNAVSMFCGIWCCPGVRQENF